MPCKYGLPGNSGKYGGKIPLPDLLICCNNICNTVIKWYENIARELQIPLIMFDMPLTTIMKSTITVLSTLKGNSKRLFINWNRLLDSLLIMIASGSDGDIQ